MVNVTVLGSGVIGCSVALAAHAAGHAVHILGARRLTDGDAQSTPFFASAYPVASVVPHHVPAHGLEAMFDDSNAVYEALTEDDSAGVRLQRHLELFEDPSHVVKPLVRLRDLESVEDSGAPCIPKRRGASSISGFTFRSFFCNMPTYAAWLDRKIDQSPIEFECRRLDPSIVSGLEADVVVNCLGSGSSLAFPELGSGVIYRGILVRAEFEHPEQEIVSYNYTPEISVYREGDDTPTDLYFFPRDGHCMLGGTRQLGHIRESDRSFVASTPLMGETIEIDEIDVPRPIIDINRQLIEQLTGRLPSGPYSAVVGYRHLAGDADSPQLIIAQREAQADLPIIDCYGFGGAGVTLSWGAALKVMRIVDKLAGNCGSNCDATQLDSLTRSLLSENC